MAAKYSDAEIAAFVRERKPLPDDYRSNIQLRNRRGHQERELDVKGTNNTEFRLILRQSDFNALDFSIILAMRPVDSSQLFRLRRYNGKSHEHTNQIEGNKLYNFHVHMATERYQELGMREDAYAEASDRFADFHGALQCMLNECGFEVPRDPQGRLFGEA